VGPRGPARGLAQGGDRTFDARRIHRAVEIGGDDQRADAQALADIETAAEMIEVRLALLAAGLEQPALKRCRGRRHSPIFEQLPRVTGAVLLEMGLQLGEPDFHGMPARVGVGGNVLGKRRRQRRDLTDARLHYLSKIEPEAEPEPEPLPLSLLVFFLAFSIFSLTALTRPSRSSSRRALPSLLASLYAD